ncbi:Ku protein [Massilia arenosa]|uniref:Non-homologous end joining protein Ku n=1 Tax=Zemynaea arenosa TaxID=2561931 RepID=A0A4Y9SIU6_9BURK|nr:Ku protein [Massilia arenosa]TFW25207.1 Ku protein [Massilia arenosa]
MARSMWKGAISFGLVHIPVEMYPATREHSLDLTMLDKRDFSPIGFKRYNKGNEKEVTWDNIVKGYEYTPGEYVVLSDEDLRRANVEATQTIDILAFVDGDQVPLIYYDQPYYLAPGKGGDKVYALLRETLCHAGKVGIATVVIRVKQHLCALVCMGDVIVMNTLRYQDEIRATDELKIPARGDKKTALTDKELKMALALVEGMSEEWKPEQYHDTYREDVLALIEKKVASGDTKTLTQPEGERERPATGNVIDLVALLQQSLGGGGKAGGKESASSKRTAANDDDSEEDAAPAPKRRAAAASKSTSHRTSTKTTAKSTAASKTTKTAAKSTTTRARKTA